MSRRPTGRVRRHVVARRVAAVDLAAQIAAAYTAANWTTPGIFLARSEADFSLVSGAVATWINRGSGGNATQATATARPAYSATAVNSRPGITLDGGDVLSTGAIDLSPYTAAALSLVSFDSDTALRFLAHFGAVGSNGRFALATNEGTVGSVEAILAGSGAATIASSARTTGSFGLASPAVVTGTYNRALSASETEIRVGGANATSARPLDGNTAGNLPSGALHIGATEGGTLGMTGGIAAIVLAAGTTAIPTSTVANVEVLLATQWGLS